MSTTPIPESGTEQLSDSEVAPAAPCSLPCPKCGSSDIHRRFWQKGEDWRRHDHTARQWENEFVTVEKWDGKAKKDCITHHCRCCQWDWATAPLREANA